MERYYSCGEIAQRYGVTCTTVRNWIGKGWLIAIHTGKNYYITPHDLTCFEKERRTVKRIER